MGWRVGREKVAKFTWLLKKLCSSLFKLFCLVCLNECSQKTRDHLSGQSVNTRHLIKLFKYSRDFFMRLSLESPLMQSLTKKKSVPLCYCVQMTLMLGTPPPHPIINEIIKITSSVIAMFRCPLKVEVGIQILIQCVWTYTQSQTIAHFATFPFWPFPPHVYQTIIT